VGDPFPKNCPFSWGIWTLSNLWFLGPVLVHNPNGIIIGSAVFTQVTAECHYTLQWAPIYHKLPLAMGASGPHLIHGSLGQPESSTQTVYRCVQPFLHSWPQSVPILYHGTPLKIASSHGGIWTPSNTWSLSPTQVLNPNGISIGSAVFAGLTSVTDRQTDRLTTLLGL